MEKTKNIKKTLGTTEKVKLFLALNVPHKPVTTVTISSWIVQTIKMAYANENLKVYAHSTRAIAPSWDLYKGASTITIFEAADWAS